jgi:hypothetical protein
MKTLEFSVETKQLISVGDIFVDVDIRFVDKQFNPRNVQEKLVVDKLNSELGMIGHQIKQMIKEQLEDALKN